MKILLEYIVVFVAVYFVNYIFFRSNVNKRGRKKLSPEMIYLKKIYKINISKLNYESVTKAYCFVNTFIISTLYIILMYLLDNWIFRVLVGVVLLILLIIICYGILGRYYAYKVNKDD